MNFYIKELVALSVLVRDPTASLLSAIMSTPASTSKVYTQKEIESHNTKDDLWLAIGDKVYDVTAFLSDVC